MGRKEMLKKLASYALIISMVTGGTSLISGCKKDKKGVNQDDYIVVVQDKNAIVYERSDNRIKTTMKDGKAMILDGDKQIIVTNYIEYRFYTKEEVEEKIKELLGEDVSITYYGFEEKKLKKENK